MGVKTKPPPDNLGTRHRALNARVNETAVNKAPFDAVRDEPETTEVDKLYKIDVAAKYKNVDYIIEMLKSGDSLHTSRALKKCQWLYEDEYSHIINLNYLQENIFPYTSMKMKRKIVKTAAARVTKPERAVEFFHYCMKEKMKSTAFTSLLYTTEEFKLDQLQNNKEPLFKKLEQKDILYFRFFVGKSFILLDALLNFISINWKITETARLFKNFFSYSEEKYLDIAEKYVSTYFGFQSHKFDVKLSDAIMKRHKHRVIEKPKFYVNTVDTDVLVRNSTIEDAKIYAKALLPDNEYEFWVRHNYSIFGSVFRIIPHDKTYQFFKDYFAENYPDTVFDMHPGFYEQGYYKFMTVEQREEWAYRHLKSEKQILGVGRDYLWYKFIKFDVAFEEIKRYISVTQDADKRSDMALALLECVSNDREIEALINYYNKRHMNESRKHREIFFNKILSDKNVFEFDEKCWTAFYTLMFAMDKSNTTDGEKSESITKDSKLYKTIALLYHILYDKEMPDDLIKFLLEDFETQYIETHLKNIDDEEKQQKLHEYFFAFYMKIITENRNTKFEYNDFNDIIQPKWRRYFDNIEKSMELFNEYEEECRYDSPNQKSKRVRYVDQYEISGRALLRNLKKDKELVIANLQRAQGEFEAFPMKVNTFLKKLRVYFPDDVTKIYLDMFHKIILEEALVLRGNCHRSTVHVANAVRSGVNAIFHLADGDAKIDFMKKYCPVGTKLDRKSLGIQHLRIQRAICRYACLSRPPVPLSMMLTYMKGDYMKYCLHIFNTYLALLPLPMCQQFVRLVIDAPVSVQKHAIRMAFQCYNTEHLKEAILNIWKNTKNVSLRSVIYKAFFNKVLDTKEKVFYDVLESLTLDLSQDDEDAIFDMIVSNKVKLPEDFLGNFIETVWVAVNKFKDLEPNITRKKVVIIYIRDHINYLSEEFVSAVVTEHLDTMIRENKLELTYSKEDIAPLYREKWTLIPHYILHFNYPQGKYTNLAQYIVQKNIGNWDKMAYGIYIHQKCCWDFFKNLKKVSLEEEYADFEEAIPVFEGILKIIDSGLQFYDSYLLTWELKLVLISAHVISNGRKFCKEGEALEVVSKAASEFGDKVGKLVSQYVQSNKYFMSFSSQVKDNIRKTVEELIKLIYEEIDDEHENWKWKEHLGTVLIYLAAALIKFDLPETYLLAIQLVPTDSEACSSDMFKCLMEKFQEFPNGEVQLCLYQRLQKFCDRKHTVSNSPAPCNIN